MNETKEVREVKKPGLVMIDGTYGFKVCPECYVFGKVKDGEIVGRQSYPTTIDSLFRIYSKQKVSDIVADRQLNINELLDAVNETKNIIKEISSKLTV